jgi:hypothetical protein
MSETIFEVKKFDKVAFEKEAREGLSDKSYKNKIESAIQSNFLPEKGMFIGYELVKVVNTLNTEKGHENDLNHFVMITDTKDRVSVSSLQALAYIGKKEDCTFKQVTRKDSVLKDKWVLASQPINPQLVGSQGNIIEKLLGRKFITESTKDTAYVLPVVFVDGVPKGYDTIESAKEALTTKNFYKVTLL